MNEASKGIQAKLFNRGRIEEWEKNVHILMNNFGLSEEQAIKALGTPCGKTRTSKNTL